MQKLDSSGFDNLSNQKVAELTQANAALGVQSRLFRLVAEISTQLARSDDFLTTLRGVLQKLGEAAHADRVSLWEERERSPGGPSDHVIVTEWCAPGILSHAECGLDVIASDAADQITGRLRLGESHFVKYEQINLEFRKLFDRLGILSIASAPIIVNGLYTGCVAFYLCKKGQILDDRHLDALTAAADAIAASIQQRRDAKRLSDERALALKGLSEERIRIARELHDSLLQGFTGITMQLRALSRKLRVAAPESVSDPESIVVEGTAAIREARRAVGDMRANEPEPSTLLDSLRNLVASQQRNYPDVHIDFRVSPNPLFMSELINENIFCIVRECLHNAMLHSRAKTIHLEVSFGSGLVIVEVSDDGIGFDTIKKATSGHWGLIGMRERAKSLGGECNIESSVGNGTRVCARIPL